MSDQSTTYPYDTIAYINAIYGTFFLQGSGVLISPDEVLTASHVVYVQGVGLPTSITVSPGHDLSGAPLGTLAGTVSGYNPIADANDIITFSDSQQDYALIHLALPQWDLGTMWIQPDFAGGPATLTGYPATAGGAQVTSAQNVARNPDYTILNGQQLGLGSSGGPVWINSAAGPTVVGVISSESQTTTAGYNTLITDAALSQISARVALDDARIHATSTHDFNGDGYSDLTFQQGGSILQWDMQGGSVIAGGNVTNLDPGASYLGSGDFEGLGRSAMLWRDPSGLLQEWQMNGTAIVSATPVPVPAVGPEWHLLAVGNFNGTGKSGLLWQNDAGLVVTWQMDGASAIGGSTLGTLDSSWRFITAGDLDGDGTTDAVWENTSGTVKEWQFGQGRVVGSAVIGAVDSTTRFFASGDFNGDGRTDLMWQEGDGSITEWAMNGASILGAGPAGALTPGDWSVVGTGDYNRDGRSDLMLRSNAGQLTEWEMNGNTILGAANVSLMDPAWKPLL